MSISIITVDWQSLPGLGSSAENLTTKDDEVAYNALVQSWPEIQRLVSEHATLPAEPQQTSMFG